MKVAMQGARFVNFLQNACPHKRKNNCKRLVDADKYGSVYVLTAAVKMCSLIGKGFKNVVRDVIKNDNMRNMCINVARRRLSSIESSAVVYSEYGDPNKVLKSEKHLLKGPLKDNEVLVKMLMAPVNPSDINMIEGTYFLKPPLPAIVGNEGVGEIIELGGSVKSLSIGDWVIPSQAGFGTWRSHAIAEEDKVLKVANDIPPLSAATIAVNPCTAYRMLKDFVNLKPSDVVIQNSSNSAVGQSVIQIAKAWNIKTINIVRNRENLDGLVVQLKGLGADHVVTEEFVRTPDFKALIKSLNSPPKLAFNGVGGKSATELLRHLGHKGVMVTYGGMSRQPVTIPTGVFIFKEVKAVGYWNSQWNVENANSKERAQMFEELCDLIRECKLIPPPSEIFDLANYKEAVKDSMSGFQDKKKVLAMTEF